MPHLRAVLLLSSCLAAWSCAENLTLQGSLKEVRDLEYQSVLMRVAATVWSIQFRKPKGEGFEDVFVLNVNHTDSLGTSGFSSIDLAEVLSDGGQRGACRRNVIDDELKLFPDINRGSLELKADPTTATKISGSFTLTFVSGDTPVHGRTVSGAFTDAPIEKIP